VRFKGETFLETAGIAGADAVLRKPFDKRVLLDTLRGLAPGPR